MDCISALRQDFHSFLPSIGTAAILIFFAQVSVRTQDMSHIGPRVKKFSGVKIITFSSYRHVAHYRTTISTCRQLSTKSA